MAYRILSAEMQDQYHSFWSQKNNNKTIDKQNKPNNKVVNFVSSRAIIGHNTSEMGDKLSGVLAIQDLRHRITNSKFKEQLLFDCSSSFKLTSVLSSQWLDDQSVIFGTRCNQLIVVNTLNGCQYRIPTLESNCTRIQPEDVWGIHAIDINPSGTLLATIGENSREVAIYRLPNFDPICIGVGGHSGDIVDMKWLNNELLVSGSLDARLVVWRFENKTNCYTFDDRKMWYNYSRQPCIEPLFTRLCQNGERIRAIAHNKNNNEIVVLSVDDNIHLFDCHTYTQTMRRELTFNNAHCLSQARDNNLLAVGTDSHITLIDGKCAVPINNVLCRSGGNGVSSLSIEDNLITAGTGDGCLCLYDLRNIRITTTNSVANADLSYFSSHGSRVSIENNDTKYLAAIYTHRYNSSKTRLFSGGRPNNDHADLAGYAGVWY